jgi:Lrp/AsnC family leucine-responsive transcriptional regulator
VDRVDREILAFLMRDGRATWQEVGKAVRLSPNATADRVRRLREEGVLQGYRAVLNLEALGIQVTTLTDVQLREGYSIREFERSVHALPQVLSAVRVTGDYDFQLRLATTGTAELEEVIDALKNDHGVRTSRTRLVLGDVPLDPERLLTPPRRRSRRRSPAPTA